MNYGGKPPPLGKMPDAPPPGPLGPSGQVRRSISTHLPGVDWSDPIMVHVRGRGDAIAAMLAFANPLGWSLLDCSTGEFLDPENPSSEGWTGFQAFRDQDLGSLEGKKPKGKGKRPKGKGNRKDA